MSIRSFFVSNCLETAALCNKAEYQEASFREKMKIRIHLFLCTTCKVYNKRNRKLTSLIDKADLKCCTEDEKTVLKQHIENGHSPQLKKNEKE